MVARVVVFWVLVARCRYRGAARYGDRVEVATRVLEVRSRTVTFEYELSIDSRRIATGETTLMALDLGRRPRRIPDDVRALLTRGPAAG